MLVDCDEKWDVNQFMMDSQLLEDVEVLFKFLWSQVTAAGEVEAEVHQRVLEGTKY